MSFPPLATLASLLVLALGRLGFCNSTGAVCRKSAAGCPDRRKLLRDYGCRMQARAEADLRLGSLAAVLCTVRELHNRLDVRPHNQDDGAVADLLALLGLDVVA